MGAMKVILFGATGMVGQGARAMIRAARDGYSRRGLENRDINALGGGTSSPEAARP